MQVTHNLSLYRGDTRVWRYTLENYDDQTETATPVDLSKVKIECQFRVKQTDPDVWAQLPITVTNASAGQFSMTIDKALAESLHDVYDINGALSGFYDIQLSTLDGKEVWTPIKGTVSITRDVTRAD